MPLHQIPTDDSLDESNHETELRFQTLFEQAPFSVQLLGPGGRTLRVNKAWEALWLTGDNQDLKEYVLTQYNMLEDPQLREKGVTAFLQKAFDGESVALPAILYDPTELGKPGQARWVTAFAHPIKSKDGRVREVMLIHEDVTARVEAERAVNVNVTERILAETKLKEANRRKDEFLAMLAHELRNPLAPISTASHLLRMGGISDKIRTEATEIIARQVKHMTELVDDLLDVSRVTRGLVELNREHLDLKPVVADAIEQTRALMETRHHVLTTWIDGDHISVHGDRTRLVQVLANLLNNAAKYTPRGGEIALRIEARAHQVVISIKDNGSGIEAELLPHVFDLFTQGDRTPDRSQGGLGIGLALVKTMVSLHGGDVTARSEGLGKGSTFTVALPLAHAAAAAAERPEMLCDLLNQFGV